MDFDELHRTYVDGLRTTYNIPKEWKYLSLRVTKEAFQELVDSVERKEIRFVVVSNSFDSVRFSCFVSKKGAEQFVNRKKNV